MMADTTIKKNQKADIPTKGGSKYSYQYVDIAQIHEYLEQNNFKYYQFIKRIENDDYIFTQKQIKENNKWVNEGDPLQGCRVVDATLYGNDNPAQKQGSALTYARRYSLLMAYGLATEDDDANSLNKLNNNKNAAKEETKEMTLEDAQNFMINFGKHRGSKLIDLMTSDENYVDWLKENGRDDVKKAISLLSNNEGNKEPKQEFIPNFTQIDDDYDLPF